MPTTASGLALARWPWASPLARLNTPRMGENSRAVRPPDRRIPGLAMDARRHADATHRLAADSLCRGALARAGRQCLSRSDAGGAGEDLRGGHRAQDRPRSI